MNADDGNLFSFQDLKVWQKSVLFAEKVIRTIEVRSMLLNSHRPPASRIRNG